VPPAIPTAAPPESVAVVGLGQIGASLLGALRLRLPGVRRIGVARRGEIAERALAEGLADEVGTDAAALSGADVVVLCTPVDAMRGWLERIRDGARPAPAVVTDAGSTKAWIVEQAEQVLGADRFVGGHPLAGRERSGYDAGDPALFEGAVWVLTPAGAEAAARIAPWAAAVEAIGASVVAMDPVRHDAAVAVVSHVPFAVSAALMRAAAGHAAWPDAQSLAATGFRDMTRVAGGDPAMYAAITETNAAAMLDALAAVERELRGLRDVLRAPGTAQAWFAQARDARAAWLEGRERAGRPVR
jgi:prephenate dehydrogenase